MGIFHRSAVGLAAGLSMCAAAQAASPVSSGVEASLSWQLGFGGRTLTNGYSLALGYRPAEVASPHAPLLALDVDGREASATLAGLPLYSRSYQANQSGDSAEATVLSGERPWYTRSWVFWTAGGLAATAALASSADAAISSDDGSENGNHGNPGNNNNGGIGCSGGGNVGPQDIPSACAAHTNGNAGCVGDSCVVCTDGTVAAVCSGGYAGRPEAAMLQRDVDRQRWLDAGTGRMGDLLPVAR